MTKNLSTNPVEDAAARQAEQRKEDRKARARAANPDVPFPQAGSSSDDEDPDT